MNDTETARELFFEALRSIDAADYENAAVRLHEALALAPGNVSSLTNLAVVSLQRNRIDEARAFSESALAADAINVEALLVLANCCARADEHAEALASCDRILAIEPGLPEVHSNRAQALNGLHRYGEAVASCDRAIVLEPGLAGAHANRGNALAQLRRHGEALGSFEQALRLNPDLAEARLGLGNALVGLRRCEEAIAAYDHALVTQADLAAAWVGRADALADLFRLDEALGAIDHALAIKPDMATAWTRRGNVLRHLTRFSEAFAAFDSALQFDPQLAEALVGRASVFENLGRYDEALSAYDEALALRPDSDYIGGRRLSAKLWTCRWQTFDDECAKVLSALRKGAPISDPVTVMAISSVASDQLKSSELYAAENVVAAAPALRVRARESDRIRIAYLSPDFRDHPLAFLTAGMFEQHDKSRFDTFGVSLFEDRESAMRERIGNALTGYIDASARDDVGMVDMLRALGIDIAVDLAGYTRHGRPGVLARRVAPIQIGYLGFPGTMGAPFIDYIIADRIVIPPELRRHYAERVVDLPDTFQANDDLRRISDRTPSRAEMHLPDQGFVFCSFHSSHKINPAMFDRWMRLLQQVEGSVLWLVAYHQSVIDNLRREAEIRSVDPARLIFAPRLPYPDHLARYRLADLFLDTLPFNGGATTSDALWAGLPVLTLPGETFASRMSASLLDAIGLPELVADSPSAYEAVALRLARDASSLGKLRAKLARNRATYPLFDTARFTRHIESAYSQIWARHRRGEPPQSFSVAAVS
jgi:protein O-GlcNAc transferase